MINVSIWLYGKPAWDMAIEGEEDIDSEILKQQGNFLRDYLNAVADAVEKLQSANWACSGGLYTLEFYKEKISKKEARKEIKDLGIDRNLVHIEEYEEIEG